MHEESAGIACFSCDDAVFAFLSLVEHAVRRGDQIGNGAVAVQPKEDPTENLVRAIRSVLQGQRVFPPEIRKFLAVEPPLALTDKQTALLQLVQQGLTDKQIAARLDITDSGVKKHLRLIFAKLGAANRTEATAIALQKHLLTT